MNFSLLAARLADQLPHHCRGIWSAPARAKVPTRGSGIVEIPAEGDVVEWALAQLAAPHRVERVVDEAHWLLAALPRRLVRQGNQRAPQRRRGARAAHRRPAVGAAAARSEEH